MNCKEFEANLEQWEGRGHAMAAEAVSHMEGCVPCAELKADFEAMLEAAIDLPLEHEPPARIWENIEYTLRTEGVIRPYAAVEQGSGFTSSIFTLSRWAMVATAVVVLATGVLVYNGTNQPQQVGNGPTVAEKLQPKATTSDAGDFEEDSFLAEVEKTAPSMKPMYAKNLKKVNQYIADAREAVIADPNDEEAVASLRDAQNQRAMLMDMAATQSMR